MNEERIEIHSFIPSSAEQESLLNNKNVTRYGSFLPPADIKRRNRSYTVEKGDTLAGIAVKFDTSLESLKVLNKQLYYNSKIDVGDQLFVPVVKDSDNDNPLALNDVNGLDSTVESPTGQTANTSSAITASKPTTQKTSMHDFLSKIDSNFTKARSNIDKLANKSQNNTEQW